MARRAASSWPIYLEELLILWDQFDLGPDFKVGNLSRADVEELLQKINAALSAISLLESQLGVAISNRELIIRDLERLGVQFRLAIAIKYGLQSPEVQRLPKLAAPPKGRGGKKKKTEEESAAR